MAELRVPKLNNNDTEYLVVEWLVPDGGTVAEGDPIVVVETSKAAEELPAPAPGILRHDFGTGAWCRPDERIATIATSPAVTSPAVTTPAPEADPTPPTAPPQATPGPTAAQGHVQTVRHGDGRVRPSENRNGGVQFGGYGAGGVLSGGDRDGGVLSGGEGDEGTSSQPAEHRFPGPPLVTAPAQALMAELGITPEQVSSLGLRLVRRADVERLARTVRRHDLPRVQRAVARAVELSHQSIPAAYVVVRMDLAPALAHARAATKEIRRPVGLAEIFVQAVAELHEPFPLFFATLHGTQANLSATPDIGVTLDVGAGLYVPVIHDAARRTTKDVATTLMRHRLAATSGDFRESDLAGANFVITLHTEGGVVLAIPFVFPGTVCALAVTAPQDGSPAEIGLAYDHRLINGRDAALFMAALRTAVEGLPATGSA